jgi:polyvinyl alcohol dehydrogenase (cytochrome)
MAIDRHSGRLVWKTDVDAHPWSQVTSQPVVVGHRIVVGVSSSEETVAESGDYPCCSFRGSIISLDGHSGRILWKTYAVPPNPEGRT